MPDSELVVVHAFHNGAEAELAKSALEAAGIDSMIQADSGGGMRPHLAWAGVGFQILVREDDAAAAREVLDLPAKQIP
jgi:tRNA U34 5-carboxymethylaminomethyl modifying enzyme MnmG/GidA